MDELFNAAWNNVGLTSDSADYLLSDGTSGNTGGYNVTTPPDNTGDGSWLGGIWSSITDTASKVVDYWGQSVVQSNQPNYVVSGSTPNAYRAPPVDQAAQQDRSYTSAKPWLIGGAALAAVALAVVVLKK